MKEKVIAVFVIEKTSKKLLVFNHDLTLIEEYEEKFPMIRDEDGFECDDIELIEKWVKKSVSNLIHSSVWDLIAVNFTTKGPALIFLDSHGRPLTQLFNQSKPIDISIPGILYEKYGGIEEFCLRTASPAVAMNNSGIQILWLKQTKPEVFSQVRNILHLPQYLSYLLSGNMNSEFTSVGRCSSLWDFDNMNYHRWVSDESIPFPDFYPSDKAAEIKIEGNNIFVGTGVQDILASLVPFFGSGLGEFILVLTGSDCISLNPFNNERLTSDQLAKDCCCYLSHDMKQIKSSRYALGQLHDTVLDKMSRYFKIQTDSFKLIKPDIRLFNKLSEKFRDKRVFLKDGDYTREMKEDPDLFEFDHFVEAYHQLMIELSDMTLESINLVIPETENLNSLILTGRFSENDLFVKLIASSYPHLNVFTTAYKNISGLGAAQLIYNSVFKEDTPRPEIGLKECTVGR
jgi:hypothetical protein